MEEEEITIEDLLNNNISDQQVEPVVDDSATLDIVFNNSNTPLITADPLNIGDPTKDEYGIPMKGTTSDVVDDGQDVDDLQITMQTQAQLQARGQDFVDSRVETTNKVKDITNKITEEKVLVDRNKTAEHLKRTTSVGIQNYQEVIDSIDLYNQNHIDKYGVEAGYMLNPVVDGLQEELAEVSNNANIISRVDPVEETYNFNEEKDQYLGTDLNEDGLIVASALLKDSTYQFSENETWNNTLLDKIKKGTHGYNPVTQTLELLDTAIDASDNILDIDQPAYSFDEGELAEEKVDLDNFTLNDSAKARMMAIMLEGTPQGTNMRDLFLDEDLDTFQKFSTFTQNNFKKITLADPVLQGYKELVNSKLYMKLTKKRAEINNSIIAPCAEKNEGVATAECLTQANAAISQWYNSEWEKNYVNNPNVMSIMNQYKIGYVKLINSIAKPYARTNNDTYREIDDRMQREGIDLTSLSRDALAKLGFGTDQFKSMASILYNRSGVTGDKERKLLLERFANISPDLLDAIKSQPIKNLRGGIQSRGYSDNSNNINFNQAYNISEGVIVESSQLRNYSQVEINDAAAAGRPKPGDYYYDNQVPGGVEYIMHGGAGSLSEKDGSIQIKTQEDFDKYFPDGNRTAIQMLNNHGQLWFSPISSYDFNNAKNVVTGVDKWAVAGGGGGSAWRQTAIAGFYGNTFSTLEDITLQEMFVGKEDEDFASVLEYDASQNLKLFQNTSDMLNAEILSGLALNPDAEFDDMSSLIRHIVGQADTLVPLYAGGILETTGKAVSKLPGYGKPIGYTMQGGGKVLQVLGSVNMMAKEFTSNLVASWRETIKQQNGGKEPTQEEFIELMMDPSTDAMIMKSLAGSAAQTAMEKLGVDASLFGLRNPGGALIASLYRKEIIKFVKQMPRAIFNSGISAAGEGLTEGIQGYIHEMTVNWSLGMGLADNLSQSNFDREGFQVGWRLGLAMPIPISLAQQSAVEINQIGMDVASKLILDPSTSTSIFSPMAAANNFFKQSIEEINKQIDSGTISKAEGRSVIESLSNSRNLGMKIPTTMAIEQRREYLDLLIAQDKLETNIKNTNNKQISEGNGSVKALEEVNNKIISLTEQEVTKELYLDKVGKVDKIIEATSKGKVKLFKEKNTEAINKRIEKLKLDGWKIRKQSTNNADYGNIYQKGDQQIILLNEAEILADGKINTGAHEFLHAVIYQTVKNSKGTAIELGKNLLTYIKQINPELLKDGQFKERYEQYKNAEDVSDAVMGEEILTLFSEAVLDGAIELNTSAREQIGNFFSRIIDSIMGRKRPIKFDTGKDVFDFIKGYNKSVEKGKFTQAQAELLEGRAEGDLVKREYKTKAMKKRDIVSKSSKGFDKTNELFANPDFEATNRFDQKQAVEAAGGVIEAATQRLWRQGSLLTRDQFKKALENEYVQALVEYDSDRDTGTGAGSSISSKFNLRAGGVAKANLGKGESASLDSEQARQVADTTEVKDFDETTTQESSQRKKVYSSNTNQVGNLDTAETKAIIKEEVSKDILLSANKGKNAASTARIIANEAKQNYFKKLRKDIGTFSSQTYKDFINSLDTNFIKSLPVSIIKRRFGKLFGIKQTGTTKTKQTSKTGKPSYFNKPVFSVPKVTSEGLQQFKDYFLAGEKRQQSLYNILATDFALESMQELMSDKTFMSKLQTSLGNQGITSKEFMQNIENKLDARTVEDTSLDVVKASKKYKSTAKIVEPSIKDSMSDKGLGMYAIKGQKFEHDKFTDDQIKERNESVLLTIPEFGLDFYEFTNSTSGKTRSSDSFGAGSGRTIFNFNAGNNIDQLKDLLNAPLTGAFIEANPEYVKKYTKTIGNDVFLDKDKLKKGSSLSAKDITVLKRAESEQGKYAKLSPEKRIELLRDKKFRDNQAEKSKILKKILNVINKNVRKDGKIIPGRMEFWASWINSQVNNSKHVMRVLAPIEFFSLSKIPKSTFVEGYKEVEGIVVSGNPLNYVAEHLMPANNAAKIAVDLIYNNTVNKDFSLIKDNYIQGQLLKTDDVIVGKAGYTSQFPSEFWEMDKPNVWVRYLLGNPNINLNEYVTYKDGKVMTIAESLGLPLDKSLRNPDSINFQNKLLKEILGVYKENNTFVLKEPKSIKSAKAELKDSQIINGKSSKKVNVNQKTLFNLITPNSTTEASIEAMGNADKTVELGNKASKKRKGISVFDFDDTLAFSKSMVIVNMPDGTTTKISPAQFASEAELLEQNGAEFDFTEFEKVVKGRKGPLADLALKRQDKFGSGDIFVLTARPQASAVSIKKFLDGIGLNLPIENITGLANGSPDAKALWVLDKTAKGYNDFYFADDALANVQAVKNILDQVDVKSDVQLAKSSKKERVNKEFNVIIEQQSGKEWYKTYSDARAKVEGKAANRFEFLIPPSAEDFTGLLYKILPKGEKGNLAKQWIQDNLLDPFNEAEQLVIKAKIAVAQDFQELRKNIKNVPKNLSKPSGHSNFTFSQALRVHIWTMQGMDIPGLSTRDKNALNKLIENNPALKVFSEKIAFIQKGKEYPGPNADWVSGSITSDIINGIQKVYRKEALQGWQENVDIIFSKENMNKLEAIYGSNFTTALSNMLSRMKRGSNRPVGGNAQVENVMDWLNNSVGAIMFLNVKSGLLQLISSVNFMNWSDNNPLKAGLAFANQKQYWKDVMYLMNSDYLVQRRNGLKINVAESEIAEASKKGGIKGVISYLLNKGFIFTRIADSLAISTGGSSFYRNRVNSLLKQVNIDTGKVYTKAEAEAKAFNDFYQISEESQQSSRTDRISMQQASGLGRLVLNFANTPMQYARIIKKSTKDLLAGRGDWKTNLSKIFYYGAMQNLIFNAMQAAVFTTLFKEDDDEEKERRGADDKAMAIGQGMLSSLLRGLGYGGALVDTLIAISLEVGKQSKKKTPDFEEAVWSVFDYSPAIDSKIRKLRSAAKTYKYNRKEIYRRGFNLDNPAYLAVGQVISASTNIPADRALRLMMSLKQMSDKDLELWQRAMLFFGYSSWQAELPYWGTKTTLENEEREDAQIKIDYKRENTRLKQEGYKRRPMTKGIPDGTLNVDYIRVVRPTGDYEYWLMPKK